MHVLVCGKSCARSRLQSSSVELIDTFTFHRPRGKATRDHNSEAVIKPEDTPVEELVVKGAERQTVI